MSPPSPLVIRALALCCALAATAHAESRAPAALSERPLPTYRWTPGAARPPGPAAVTSRILYMNRCTGGCQVNPGSNDSRTNTSSIPSMPVVLAGFSHGDQVWADLMACVRKTFEPFDVMVTDVSPGNVPHFENMVGGRATDLDPSLSGAGGVAPFDCGEIPNAVVFTFDVYGPDALSLCWTSAQELAHAFGLEHQFLQKDPMTYLGGNLPKRFRDVDSACGEDAPRACQCGRGTQNSYRSIVALFGPGPPTPPEVAFKYPGEGKPIQPDFEVVIDAKDEVRVEKVELLVDGMPAGTAMEPIPDTDLYRFPLPELAMGAHVLEARATDVAGTVNTTTRTVELGPPCTPGTICTGTDVCVDGVCVPGPDEPGGLGAVCMLDRECLSFRCADGGEQFKHCVEECELGNAQSCPSEFECISAGAAGVCWPAPSSGCCDAGAAPHGPLVLGLGVLVLVLRRPRRRAR